MKLFPQINLTIGCLLAAALRKIYRTCQIVKIALSEKNSFMVYFICTEQINQNSFGKIESLVNELARTPTSIESLGDCSIQEIKKELEMYKIPFSENFFSLHDWQKVQIDQDTFIVVKEPVENNLNSIKSFFIESIGGANFGDKKVDNLKVISGVGFKTDDDRRKYENECEEIRNRNHRNLGQQLGIFTFNDLVGKGFPL